MKTKKLLAIILTIALIAFVVAAALGDAGLASTTLTSPPPPPTMTATPTKAQLPAPTVTLVRPTNTPCLYWLPNLSNND